MLLLDLGTPQSHNLDRQQVCVRIQHVSSHSSARKVGNLHAGPLQLMNILRKFGKQSVRKCVAHPSPVPWPELSLFTIKQIPIDAG